MSDNFTQEQINELQRQVTALEAENEKLDHLSEKVEGIEKTMATLLTREDFSQLLTAAQNEKTLTRLRRYSDLVSTAVISAAAGSYIGHILGIWKGD